MCAAIHKDGRDVSSIDCSDDWKHNIWSPLLDTLAEYRMGQVLLECLEDDEVCRVGLTCHFGLYVVTQASGPIECGSLTVPLTWEEEV